MIANNYLVYAGYYQGDCVYVGEGVEGRELHLNSGVSHIYEANRLHFKGESVDVKVIYSSVTKDDMQT